MQARPRPRRRYQARQVQSHPPGFPTPEWIARFASEGAWLYGVVLGPWGWVGVISLLLVQG
jgi:hypothetical protein